MAINSLSASSYGLSGLVSGMDTQSMVEKLLTGTQSKIDKALQKKTTLQYKQQMYRDVAAKLNTLQSSFLSFTSKTNLLSSAFYNTMTTKINPPSGYSAAFSVSGSSSARPGTVTMDYIEQLATARTAKTQANATGAVVGTLSQSAAEELLKNYSGDNASMVVKVGDQTFTFDDVGVLFGGKTQTEVAAALNAEFGNVAEARFVNNKLQIKAANKDDFIAISPGDNATTSYSTQMFGMAKIGAQGTLNATVDTNAYLPGFVVNLDGRQETIRLDVATLREYANATTHIPDPTPGDNKTEIQIALEKLHGSIDTQLKRYFGSSVKATLANETLQFETGATSQKVTITGTAGVMNTLGLKSGISNKLTTGMTLKELNFATQLEGNQHTFTINGVQFSYTATTSLNTVINDINNSKAGVKISYLESEDRFVMQSNETGAGSAEFTIDQSEGNLMSVLFGLGGSGMTQGRGITADMTGAQVSASSIADGGTFTFNVNGTDRKFTISRKKDESAFTVESFAEEMNKVFKTSFGSMSDGTQKVEFINDNGHYTIRVNDNTNVIKAVKLDKDTNTNSLGFEVGQSTVAADGDVTLEAAGISFGTDGKLSLSVGGINFDITAQDLEDAGVTTLQQLADLVNTKIAEKCTSIPASKRPSMSFDANTGAFRLIGADASVSMNITVDAGVTGDSTRMDNIFGQMSIGVYAPESAGVLLETSIGQNAIFSIDGARMERASNSFTVEGLTYTLHDTTVTGKDPSNNYTYQDPTKITVARDTEKIVEGLQEFLKLYNETIDYVNGLYKSDATYKDYPPLTQEQKKEMSDREIELWEEKSKEGLLRNDSNLEKILSSLRTAMYTKPEGSSIAIYDLGIATSYYSNDGNFKAESIDDLRAAIEANPDAVRQLFAGEGGIMELVNNAITAATKNSYASPGYLTAVAGNNVLDTSSSIYKQIKEIDTQLATLEDRYWSEYNRYWKQFNAMEQMISQMNSQSSWLSQQFA